MAWYRGWGFWYNSPDGDVNNATETTTTNPFIGNVGTQPNGGVWYPGWGFWYQSPDGNVNNATNTSLTDPSTQGGQVVPPPNSTPAANPPVTQPNGYLPPIPEYTPTQTSARAALMNTLGYFGLASLGDFAWNQYLKDIPVEQIMLDIRQTPEYKQRFPAMDSLSQRGRAISEAQYINYEQSAAAIFKAAGLPPGFYDTPDDFAEFLQQDIALPELQSRIEVAKVAVYESDPATLAALQQYYGIQGGVNHIGDATAYFLDPDRALPAIQKQMLAAQEAAAATRTGYEGLQQTEAERLATMGIGPDKAQEGFSTLANLKPLFSNLPGEAGDAPTREEGLAAVFDNNADAATSITNRQSKRKAAFQSGGAFAQTSDGVTGL